MNTKYIESNLVLSAADAEALVLMLGEHSRRNRHGNEALDELIESVQTADIVEDGPLLEDRVTMDATVRYMEVGVGEGELTLAWPNTAAPDKGRISVLSPMGTALIGRRVGERVTVALPNGTLRILVIESVGAAQSHPDMAVAG